MTKQVDLMQTSQVVAIKLKTLFFQIVMSSIITFLVAIVWSQRVVWHGIWKGDVLLVQQRSFCHPHKPVWWARLAPSMQHSLLCTLKWSPPTVGRWLNMQSRWRRKGLLACAQDPVEWLKILNSTTPWLRQLWTLLGHSPSLTLVVFDMAYEVIIVDDEDNKLQQRW